MIRWLRWLKPRLRVRTLLLLAVVAGLALGLDGMRRRRAYCLERAAFHRRVSGNHGNFALPLPSASRRRAAMVTHRQLRYQALRERRDPSTIVWNPPPAPTEAERIADEDRDAREDPHYAWHLGWIRLFEEAAARPWMVVPAEPEEPVGLLEGHNWSI